jgi:hypothetical protein
MAACLNAVSQYPEQARWRRAQAGPMCGDKPCGEGVAQGSPFLSPRRLSEALTEFPGSATLSRLQPSSIISLAVMPTSAAPLKFAM